MKLVAVVGTRPNFVKIAPLLRVLTAFDVKLVHTGQHYDEQLSQAFFEALALPAPDRSLDVGSGSHALQTAELMRAFSIVLDEEAPQGVIVVGDVNSTLACALVTAKHRVAPFRFRGALRTRPVLIHVEAGLRSFDDEMPEELNRKVTDAISDLLYVSDPAGLENLRREGIADDRVQLVGNVMIDSLLAAKERALASDVLQRLRIDAPYALVTLHRPSNVDDDEALRSMLETIVAIGRAHDLRLVFPMHPRTRAKLTFPLDARFIATEPLGYLDFLCLQASARVVLTDSGGVQEETTVLGVPCVTLRRTTERPCTITSGTNHLGGITRDGILAATEAALSSTVTRVPALWDGRAAQRIAEHLSALFQ